MNYCQLKDNTKESVIHFIQSHLNTNINGLNFSNKPYIDNDILEELANNDNASAIINLDCHSTGISYNGIVALWNSMSFGSLSSSGMPTYNKHTGVPMITINIEVGNTKVIDQHKNKRFKYPLPLLDGFEVTYGHRCIGKPYTLFGYKKIILLDNGQELERNY